MALDLDSERVFDRKYQKKQKNKGIQNKGTRVEGTGCAM